MIEIDEYNAEAKKLADALNAAEYDFIWRVRGWDKERHIELFGLNKHDPEVLERVLKAFSIVAKTKKWYKSGRMMMDISIDRLQIDDVFADVVNFLIEGATGEMQKTLDEALEEYQRGFNGEGTGDPIGIIGASKL